MVLGLGTSSARSSSVRHEPRPAEMRRKTDINSLRESCPSIAWLSCSSGSRVRSAWCAAGSIVHLLQRLRKSTISDRHSAISDRSSRQQSIQPPAGVRPADSCGFHLGGRVSFIEWFTPRAPTIPSTRKTARLTILLRVIALTL
jgi:hypothetical protein